MVIKSHLLKEKFARKNFSINIGNCWFVQIRPPDPRNNNNKQPLAVVNTGNRKKKNEIIN